MSAISAVSMSDFDGCKAAFLNGDRVLCLLRDDIPGLPYAGHWDLPGGGREGAETPEECLLREVREEFGLCFDVGRLLWKRAFTGLRGRVWFFGGLISDTEIGAVRFGDEGERWEMMRVADFVGHPKAVPNMRERLGVMMGEGEVLPRHDRLD